MSGVFRGLEEHPTAGVDRWETPPKRSLPTVALVRAVVQRAHGGPEVLEVDEVPTPRPGPDEVLVEVSACGVNRLDVLQRDGPAVVAGFSLPHVAGMDVVGRIVDIGPVDVEPTPPGPGWRAPVVGDLVVVDPVVVCGPCPLRAERRETTCPELRAIGSTRPGGYADAVVVPLRNAWPVPDDTDPVELAALPVAFATAWHGLHTVGGLRADETLLVHAAGSGLSTAAIAIAKMLGAQVIATAGSSAKLDLATGIGADHVLSNRDPDWVESVRTLTGGGVDMAYDHVGPALFQATIDALRPFGRLVFCGTTTGTETTISLTSVYHNGKRLLGADAYTETDFAEVLAAHLSGRLRPVIDSVYPLERVAEAQARLDAPDAFGKVVLEVAR